MVVNVLPYANGERVNVGLIGLLIVAHGIVGGSGLVATHLIERCSNLCSVQKRSLADIDPGLTSSLLNFCHKSVKQTLSIKVVFHLSNMLLIAIEVPTMAIENLDECREQGAGLGASLVRCNRIDIEKDGLARMAGTGHLHGAPQSGVVLELRQDVVDGMFAGDLLVLQKHRENLEHVRFTATKEARNPCTITGGIGIVVLIEEAVKVAGKFGSNHILVELVSKMLDAGSLHNGIDRPVDWLFIHKLVFHRATP